MTGPIIPARMTAHFTTSVDPVSGAPQVAITFGAAEQEPDGTLKGKGTVNLIIDPDFFYNEVDPTTHLPTGVTIRGRRIIRALHGLFKLAWDTH